MENCWYILWLYGTLHGHPLCTYILWPFGNLVVIWCIVPVLLLLCIKKNLATLFQAEETICIISIGMIDELISWTSRRKKEKKHFLVPRQFVYRHSVNFFRPT
jgi:hypothetical protein